MIEFNNVSLWRRTQEEYSYDLKRTIFAVIERRYPLASSTVHAVTTAKALARGAKA